MRRESAGIRGRLSTARVKSESRNWRIFVTPARLNMTSECAVITACAKGSQMLSWLRRGRERDSWIESEAEMLVRDLGADAYRHARQKEREANSVGEAQEWKRVARAIASKIGKRVAVSAQADDDPFLACSERYVALPRTPTDQPEPVNRLRSSGAPPAPLQPQL